MVRIHIALAALLLAGSQVVAQQVGDTVVRRGTIPEDIYLAGGTVDVRADVQGDVVAAGGSVLIGQRVTGDILAAGGSVDVGGDVLDDVRVAGGTVTLRGHVAGDAVAAGGTVVLSPGASVDGRAWFGGGDVQVAGRVGTHLRVAARRIIISGTVDGNVNVSAQEIEVLPSTRITGSLTYQSANPARIDSAAVIGGGVVRVPYHGPTLASRVFRRMIVALALAVLGAVLIMAFPAFSQGAVRSLSEEPWISVGLGVGVFVGVPVAAVLLLVTVVGSALGIAGLVVYVLALVAGFLTGALCTGDLVLGWLRPGATRTVGSLIVALLVALVAIALVRLVPVVGALVSFGVLLFGLGGLVLQGYRAWKGERSGSRGFPLDAPTA